MLIHLIRTAAPFDFSPANWTRQTVNLPVTPLSAMVADDGKIFLLCSPRSDGNSELLNYLVADPPDDPTNWGTRMAPVEPAAGSPIPTNNAAIGAHIYGAITLSTGHTEKARSSTSRVRTYTMARLPHRLVTIFRRTLRPGSTTVLLRVFRIATSLLR
jgi:hypothetical protein